MKCPKCNGRGTVGYFHIDHFVDIECDRCNGSGRIAGNNYRHSSKCTRCNGTGEINYYTLTNEDFLRMATTNQLAEWITDIVYECRDCDDCMDCRLGWCSKDYVAEWLKQPHHSKE